MGFGSGSGVGSGQGHGDGGGEGVGEGKGVGRGECSAGDCASGTGMCCGLVCCCLCVGLPLFVAGILLLLVFNETETIRTIGVVLVSLSVLFFVLYMAGIIWVCSGGCGSKKKKTQVAPQTVAHQHASGPPQYYPSPRGGPGTHQLYPAAPNPQQDNGGNVHDMYI